MRLKVTLSIAILLIIIAGCAAPQVVKRHYYSLKGQYYLNEKKYEDGIKIFQEEALSNPDNAEAHYFLGRFHLAENHKKEAIRYLQQAVKISSEKANYHFWLGRAYAANKQPDLARKSYMKALEHDDEHIDALTYLGHSQFRKGEYENALKKYTKVLKLRPDDPLALYNRALILKRFKRTPEEKLAWKEYLTKYTSGAMARKAAQNLNALGNFDYRSHFIGSNTVTLEKIQFKPFSAEIRKNTRSFLNILGELLKNNKNIVIHIVAYQKNNKRLAEARAKSVKKYLIKEFPEIEPSRLKVSWFDQTPFT